MTEKYYFVSYSIQLSYGDCIKNTMTNYHPLGDESFLSGRTLISWQEVTKEEYDLYWEAAVKQDEEEALQREENKKELKKFLTKWEKKIDNMKIENLIKRLFIWK